MFQLTITVNAKNHAVLDSLKSCILENKLSASSVYAGKVISDSAFISIGSEKNDKRKVVDTLKDNLIKIYLTVLKKSYIEQRLSGLRTNDLSKLLLTNMLVAFDRQNEEEQLRRELSFKSNFSVDGFFNFRMKTLKARWNDVCKLATDNAEFLSNEDTVNELLKFLMCAVNPKIDTAEIVERGDGFEVTESGGQMREEIKHAFSGNEQLLLYLIDAAPAKIVLKGQFNNIRLYKRITSIFDGAENML